MRCVIFSGADIDEYKFVASYLRGDDFVICADSGLRHAERLNITPDLVIGDFDSLGKIPDGIESVITLPCEKDVTDTYAAAEKAVESGATEVLIFGAVGTRLDHTFGNIATLEYLRENNVFAHIIDSHNEIMLIKNEKVTVNKDKGTFLSLIPLDYELSGVTLSGVKYPLENARVFRSKTLTISNEITADLAEISVKNGSALVIVSRD